MESQDAIFDIYTKIHATFETVENIRVMDKYLHTLIKQLFEYHKFEDIMAYYKTKSEIKLPVLKDNYASDRDVPELTYLRNEYYGLIWSLYRNENYGAYMGVNISTSLLMMLVQTLKNIEQHDYCVERMLLNQKGINVYPFILTLTGKVIQRNK